MPVTNPMSKAQAKHASKIADARLYESQQASKNAVRSWFHAGESKNLRRARKRLNARRNFHASYPESKPAGHAHKAPGSMKK